MDIDKSMLRASSRYDCSWTVLPNQWPCCLINAQILISTVFWISVSQKSSAAVVDSGLKNLKNPETRRLGNSKAKGKSSRSQRNVTYRS